MSSSTIVSPRTTEAVLLGLDIGTGGARAVAMAADGALLAQAVASYPLACPRPGWTEQDPDDWWHAAAEVLHRVSGPYRDRVAAIGLTGQMHGAVFLDARQAIIRPALLWNDQRTGAQAEDVARRIRRDRLVSIAGSPALTGFQAPKIRWLAEAEPERYARLAHVLLPKDHVRLRLTGELATDASDASGTLLLDVRRRAWSPEILDALEIDPGWLPTVHESATVAGRLRPAVAHAVGLPTGLPVAAGAGDNAAAAVGLGIVREGLASASIGTSGVIFAHRNAFTPDRSLRVHACAHAVPGAYHLMGVALSAGAALDWWRAVAGGDDLDVLLAEAATSPPGARGLVFLPYLAGERTPHQDLGARGAFIGLASHHERADLTRAVLEGVAFALLDGLDAIRSLGVEVSEIRATGGGARSALWRRIQADVYGVPVRRAIADQGAAYGAALLAGVAAGCYADVGEAAALVRLREQVDEPDPSAGGVYGERAAAYRSLYGALRETMHDLASAAQDA